MATYDENMSKQAEWNMVCRAYCKKIGAKLIFANYENGDFGYETKDGHHVHMHYDELYRALGGTENI